MYRSILVPVDGSDFGWMALHTAVALARRTAAELHVVHVRTEPLALKFDLESDIPDAEYVSLLRMAARAEDELDRPVVTRLIEAGLDLEPHAVEPRARIAAVLARYIAENAIDLVVMATHGRGAAKRVLMGSVADALVHTCTVPLFLIRPDAVRLPAFGDGTLRPRHIMIALDGSSFAERAIEPALALGVAFDAEFTLVRIAQAGLHAEAVFNPFTAFPDPALVEQERAEAEAYLERVAERLRRRSLRVRTVVLAGTGVPYLIEQLAGDVGADTIALATHGDTGLTRLLAGSVADQLVRQGERPVLVLHADPRAELAGAL